MTQPARHRARVNRSNRALVVVGLIACVGAVAMLTSVVSPASSAPEQRPPYQLSASTSGGGQAQSASTRPTPPVAAVTALSVTIPSIGVHSDLVGLAIEPDSGALVPPARYDVAGWYTGASVPGDVGPAIITGHVDSYQGPGVFFALEDVVAGDRVRVARSDGRAVDFRVVRVAQFPKSAFPTDEVYGLTTEHELRLITCGGTFDRSRRSYRDNIVVYAVQV